MEVELAGVKRKRPPSGQGGPPGTKRLAVAPVSCSSRGEHRRAEGGGIAAEGPGGERGRQRQRERYRTEIAKVYGAYEALVRGQGGTRMEPAFRKILSAAEEGSSAGKRLAARLIPRFVKDYPRLTVDAATSLVNLCNIRAHDNMPEPILAGIRKDAFKGLGLLCTSCADNPNKGSAVLSDIVDFLVSRLRWRPDRTREESHRTPCENGSSQMSPPPDIQDVLEALEDAFLTVPQQVLEHCWQALKASDRQSLAGVRHLVCCRLLKEREWSDLPGQGNIDSAETSKDSERPRSLAAFVLGSRPRVVAWIRKTALAFREGPPSGNSETVVELSNLLLQSLGPAGGPPVHVAVKERALPDQETERKGRVDRAPDRKPPLLITANAVVPPQQLQAEPSAQPWPRIRLQHGEQVQPPAQLRPHAQQLLQNQPPPLQPQQPQRHLQRQQSEPNPEPRSKAQPPPLPPAAVQSSLPDIAPSSSLSMDTTGPASPPALQGSHLRTAILSPPVPYMPIQELSQANSIVIPECGRLVLPAQLPPYDDGPCVWFAAIPPPLTKSNLASVCAHFGTVKALIFPPAPSIDKALMIFKTPREATLCCHTLLANLTAANAGRRMCATIPGAHNPPTEEPLGTCIWFGGSCGVATEAELQRALSAAGLPNPRHIIRVTGTTPGLIFELQSISFVPRSLQCLMPVAQEGDRQPPPATTPAPWPTRASGAESMALPPHLLPPPEPSPMDIAAPTVPPPHPPPPPWHQTVDLQRAPSGPSTSSLPEALPRPPIAPPSAPPPPLPPPDQPPPPPPPPPPYSQPPLPDSSPPPPPPPPTNPKVEHPEPPSRRRTTRFSDLPAAEGRSVGPAVASPAGGTLGPPWVGHLAKSGMNLCKVLCSAKPKVSDGGLEGQEPLGWPTVLDVRIRVDLSSVLKQMFQSFTPDKRAIRRLMPVSAASDKGPLLDFVKYLTTRSRAGVVHLDKKEGVGPRTLYLIPPSKQNCELMGVGWEPKESVIVLVVSGEGGKRA